MTTKELQKLQEIAGQKGKRLLIERNYFDCDPKNFETLDSLLEQKNQEKLPKGCLGVLRDVKVTRFTRNKNERIYPKELWLKVKNENAAENTLCLADHPEDEGSVLRIVGVWKNFRVLSDCCIADLYLTGDHGKHIIGVISIGGKLGVSSVGYGEMLEDETTVRPETYELVRLGDIVLDPSQNVFFDQTNLILNSEGPSSYIQEKKDFFGKSVTNKKGINIMFDKIQEGHFRNTVKLRIKEAKKNKNLLEAQQELQDIASDIPDELADLKQKVEAELLDIQNQLENKVKEAEKQAETAAKEAEDLQDKLEVSLQAVEMLKDKNAELSEKYKKAKFALEEAIQDNKQFLRDRRIMESDIEKLSRMYLSLKEKVAETKPVLKEAAIVDRLSLKEKITMLGDIKQLLSDRKAMLEDIRLLKTKNTKINHTKVMEMEHMKMKFNTLIREKIAMLEDIKQLLIDRKAMLEDNLFLRKESIKAKKESIQALRKYRESLRQKRHNFREDYENMDVTDSGIPTEGFPDESSELNFDSGTDATSIQRDTLDDNADVLDSNAMPEVEEVLNETDEQEIDPEIEETYLSESDIYGDFQNEEEFEDAFSSEVSGRALDPALDAYIGDDNAYQLGEPIAEKRSRNLQKALQQQILGYLKKESKKNPGLKKVAPIILKSKSLVEAVRKVEAFKNRSVERVLKLDESFSTSRNTDADWLGNRF